MVNIEIIQYEDKWVTTSLNVADVTEKAHKHVIADIERLIEKGRARPNFRPGEFFIEAAYLDANNQSRKMYFLTKKGTAWLINRYTGDTAVDFQLAYIEKFEEMENKIIEANKLITSVKDTCILTKHDESISILRSQLDAGSLLGVPLHLVQIEAVKVAKQLTGIDYSTFLKLAPAQDNIKPEEKMLEPKELETQLGIGKSGQKINKILLVFGYQTNTNGTWQPTDKAIGKYSEHAWVSGSKSGYNYKWNLDFAKSLVNQLIANYGNVDTALKELIN